MCACRYVCVHLCTHVCACVCACERDTARESAREQASTRERERERERESVYVCVREREQTCMCVLWVFTSTHEPFRTFVTKKFQQKKKLNFASQPQDTQIVCVCAFLAFPKKIKELEM